LNLLINLVRPNDAGQWRAAVDTRSRVEAQSARPPSRVGCHLILWE
jgi:hypothetical protein